MRIRSAIAAAALLSAGLAIPCAAQRGGEDVTTFNFNSTYNGGGTISGTFILDTSTDMFSSADLTAEGFSSAGDNGSLTLSTQGPDDGEYYVFVNGPDGNNGEITLPTTTLAGYDGSAICSDASTTGCPGQPTNYDSGFVAASGAIESEIAPTPEPSSLVLLATGVFGVAGIARRRFLSSR